MAEPKRAALALGGNVGEVADSFAYALGRLAGSSEVRVLARSRVYRTAPWGRPDQPDFLNMAALVETTLAAPALLETCMKIERERGRVRGERWGPRTLDIDIVSYAQEAFAQAELTLPHPRAAERAFVLIPLMEIAPDLRLGLKTVAEWAAECDASTVWLDEQATRHVSEAPLSG